MTTPATTDLRQATIEGSGGAAFFDVDKTLLPGSSLYLFARGLYRRGYYTNRDVVAFALGQLTFRTSGMESKRGIAAAREYAAAFAEGKCQDDVKQLAADIVVEVIGPRIYPAMRRVLESHRLAGDLTFLVTAAPADLADGIAAHLGMDGALGSLAEVDDSGVYTGKILGPVMHGPVKRAAVAELAERLGIDLERSSAYSDSMNDRPLLELVGHPVAVNPDRALRQFAASRGWQVQELRQRRRTLFIWIPPTAAAIVAAVVARLRRRPS